MNEDAAGTPEFGTGLKAWLERSDQAHVRLETPSCRDLLLLLYGDDVVTERQTTERVLVGGDLARRGAHGAAAA